MERFNKIYEISDVLLFLPGSIGTITELFNSICQVQIGKYKKIILYNVNYYFTDIIKILYKLYEDNLFDMRPSQYMIIESDKDKIVDIIKESL